MSSDPLASVITQVQPGQAAAHGRGPLPARPTKVAKPGTAKAAAQQQAQQTGSGDRKKKKKKKVKSKTDDVTTSGVPSSSQAEEAASASASPQQHSAQPSSTLAGTVTPVPDSGTVEVGATPGAVGIGETDEAAKLQGAPSHDQDLTKAAKNLQASAGDDEKDRSATARTATSGGPSATRQKESTVPSTAKATAKTGTPSNQAMQSSRKQKKRSPFARLIAFLTCSSGAAASVEEEKRQRRGEAIEMNSRDNATSTTAAGQGRRGADPSTAASLNSSKRRGRANEADGQSRLAPPIKTRPGRSGSRSSSARNSLDRRSETGVLAPAPGTPTAGGGTMLPREETGDVMSGAVVPPGSSFVTPDHKRGSAAPSKSGSLQGDSDDESGETDDDDEEVTDEETDEDSEGLEPGYIDDDDLNEEQRLIAQGGIGIPRDEFGNERPLLPILGPPDEGRKCLVLDLDETLVHSSFKMITNADFIVPVEIEGTVHNVYVIKRPGVDEFMRRMGEIYEVVVFTASLSKYADPVLDILDIHHVVRHRLFRESCYNHRGNYVKDLSQLGRPISESIIIDNSPASYIFHPNNAVPISSWFNDPHDTELTDLCPFLADLSDVGDVRAVLDGGL
ncbi:unnamed protein product [Sympodiomycopsis kandeliae]